VSVKPLNQKEKCLACDKTPTFFAIGLVDCSLQVCVPKSQVVAVECPNCKLEVDALSCACPKCSNKSLVYKV